MSLSFPIAPNETQLTRGPGLKAQHVSCISCLAAATEAEVTGCTVGSKSFEFKAKLSPANVVNRNIRIRADSAASVLLVFQSILPFFLFASDDKDTPIKITIHGGTNVSFSLSFEYLDQVLLPALERFGIRVDRKLEHRGWSHGSVQLGSATFQIFPVGRGQTINAPEWPKDRGTISKIDASIIVPKDLITSLKRSLQFEVDLVFPGIELNFVVVDDSRHQARMYTLLVAHTTTGLRFGRDWLYDKKSKGKTPDELATEIAQRIVDELDAEIRKGGAVDEYLQDQLVVFQALAEGRSSVPGTAESLASNKERLDRTDEPFGDGSTHTTTARWVTSQLLPHTRWIDKGRMCEGAGWKTVNDASFSAVQ